MSEAKCPKCFSVNVYQDRDLWICPECSHEWMDGDASTLSDKTNEKMDEEGVVRDANGNVLIDGDSVVVIKDLKVKGSSSSIKGGTKVKNIKLADMGDGHNIACKIDGVGSINLKSEFVKKV